MSNPFTNRGFNSATVVNRGKQFLDNIQGSETALQFGHGW